MKKVATYDLEHERLTVPYDLMAYAVSQKRFREVQVLLACKFLFNAYFHKSGTDRVAESLGVHQRTVRNHLNWLRDRNLIGYDGRSGVYFNRGFKYLRGQLKHRVSRSCGYHLKFKNLKHFKEFAIGCAYNDLIISQKIKRWQEKNKNQNWEGAKKGNPYQTRFTKRGFYPVANKAFAKIYDVSKATASRYRKMASNAGFIKLKEDLSECKVSFRSKKDRDMHRRYSEVPLIYRNGRFYEQGVTHVRCKLTPIYF